MTIVCIVYFRFVQHHVFFGYRLAFSAITQNIMTLNLLHMKNFNYLVFRNVQNLMHMKIFMNTVASYVVHQEFIRTQLIISCESL